MIELDITMIKPAVKITSIFQKIGTYSLARVIEPLQAYCRQALGEQYRSQGTRAGSKWRELTELTLMEKLRLGYGNKQILEREGDLEAAIKGVTLSLRGSNLFGVFTGTHAGLIDKFDGDRPLILFIEEDTSMVNNIIFKDLTTYLGFRGV